MKRYGIGTNKTIQYFNGTVNNSTLYNYFFTILSWMII